MFCIKMCVVAAAAFAVAAALLCEGGLVRQSKKAGLEPQPQPRNGFRRLARPIIARCFGFVKPCFFGAV